MRHPEAIQLVRQYIAELGGFEVPKALKKTVKAAATVGIQAPAASAVADSLKEGALCQIVKIMDMPVDLAPGHAVALIKRVEEGEAADGIVLSAGGAVAAEVSGDATETPATGKPEPKTEFKPEAVWTPLEDITTDYQYNFVKTKDCAGKKVDIIQDSYDPGQARGKADWRSKIDDRDDMLQHVKTDLHYWYGEGYGSERRKKPA
jgi:hypothetical protein